MKFAFLPNYFKKIGLIGFFVPIGIIAAFFLFTIICSIFALHGILYDVAYQVGYLIGYTIGSLEVCQKCGWGFVVVMIIRWCQVFYILAIACYMLAKEKIEDEYIDAIRWESLRLSIIISVGLTVLCILFNINITAKLLLFIQFLTYLIIFKIKKS